MAGKEVGQVIVFFGLFVCSFAFYFFYFSCNL